MPGSNWNAYPFDPDGHVNEIFYGIEQIGWDDYWTGITTGFVSGTAPDVFTDHLAKYPEFAKNNQLVDLAPLIGGEVRWDWPPFHKIAAAMKDAARKRNVSIVWGGDWRSFKDGPHFELDRRAYP